MNNITLFSLSILQMSAILEKLYRTNCPSESVLKYMDIISENLCYLHSALAEDLAKVPLAEMSDVFKTHKSDKK